MADLRAMLLELARQGPQEPPPERNEDGSLTLYGHVARARHEYVTTGRMRSEDLHAILGDQTEGVSITTENDVRECLLRRLNRGRSS